MAARFWVASSRRLPIIRLSTPPRRPISSPWLSATRPVRSPSPIRPTKAITVSRGPTTERRISSVITTAITTQAASAAMVERRISS